jgi:hypothetical protein
MLVEFKRSDSNSPVWVNPNHVVTVFPYTEDATCTILRLVDGSNMVSRVRPRRSSSF